MKLRLLWLYCLGLVSVSGFNSVPFRWEFVLLVLLGLGVSYAIFHSLVAADLAHARHHEEVTVPAMKEAARVISVLCAKRDNMFVATTFGALTGLAYAIAANFVTGIKFDSMWLIIAYALVSIPYVRYELKTEFAKVDAS